MESKGDGQVWIVEDTVKDDVTVVDREVVQRKEYISVIRTLKGNEELESRLPSEQVRSVESASQERDGRPWSLCLQAHDVWAFKVTYAKFEHSSPAKFWIEVVGGGRDSASFSRGRLRCGFPPMALVLVTLCNFAGEALRVETVLLVLTGGQDS